MHGARVTSIALARVFMGWFIFRLVNPPFSSRIPDTEILGVKVMACFMSNFLAGSLPNTIPSVFKLGKIFDSCGQIITWPVLNVQ